MILYDKTSMILSKTLSLIVSMEQDMRCIKISSQTKNSFKCVLRQNMSAVPQRIFPPSEAQFPKVQTSIYKAFKNAAIVTGLVSYILTLFSLDILSANIFFFPDCKRMSTRSEVCIMYYCLCCTKVRYETHFSPFQCPLPLSLGLHLTNITNAQCAVCTVYFPSI